MVVNRIPGTHFHHLEPTAFSADIVDLRLLPMGYAGSTRVKPPAQLLVMVGLRNGEAFVVGDTHKLGEAVRAVDTDHAGSPLNEVLGPPSGHRRQRVVGKNPVAVIDLRMGQEVGEVNDQEQGHGGS
jgi:hypothetical protein